jgi:LmbE family N-acetylglucosaminyl deacetylase
MPAILCVMAHPDDEAFGPAGTIASYVSKGVPVDLLTLTLGQRGTTSAHADTPESLGKLREYETRASAKVLGIRELTLLDYMDAELEKTPIDELTEHIVRAIDRGSIDAIIGMGPLGLTRHADHIAAHHATMRAVDQSTRNVSVFYIAVPEEWAKMMNVTGPEAEPTHSIDMSSFFETKLAALACHSSQEDSREFFAGLVAGGQTSELFHRARPAYNGSGLAADLFAEI